MQATFTLTPADFQRFMKLVVNRAKHNVPYRPLWFVGRVFVWLPIGAGIAAFSKIYEREPELQQGLFFVGAMFVAAVAFAFIYSAAWRRMYLSKAISPDGAFLRPQTIEVTEEGISIESIHGRTFFKWPGLLDLAEDEANLYLFIDSMQAIVIPKAIPCIGDVTKLVKERVGVRR